MTAYRFHSSDDQSVRVRVHLGQLFLFGSVLLDSTSSSSQNMAEQFHTESEAFRTIPWCTNVLYSKQGFNQLDGISQLSVRRILLYAWQF